MSGPILLGLRILAALALYSFVGWALFLIWQSLRSAAELQKSQKPALLSATIETENSIGEVFDFEQSEILIGRDETCSLQLNDSTVSAHHARFIFHHNQWWIEDLYSKNGTLLNDDPLITPAVIVNGDTISCGNVRIKVQITTKTDGMSI